MLQQQEQVSVLFSEYLQNFVCTVLFNQTCVAQWLKQWTFYRAKSLCSLYLIPSQMGGQRVTANLLEVAQEASWVG